MQQPFRCLRSILLSMATELTLYMTREHSLAYAGVWNKANAELFSRYVPGTNIASMLFALNEEGVLDVYYDIEELTKTFASIGEALSSNPLLLDHIITDFYAAWKKIFTYSNGQQEIENNQQLKEFFAAWIEWWPAMAYIFIIPDLNNVSPELKDKALQVRIETQAYSDDIDRAYERFIKKQYPLLADCWNLISLEEAMRLDELSSPDITAIAKRKNGFSLITLKGVSRLISNDEIKDVCQQFNIVIRRREQNNQTVLSGMPASKGGARGRVYVILKKTDLANIKAGDILISYATSPDYVPAMKQCAAVVTDEGGVVCHAAIVCRELGIPCIVGTKNATQVFKNGDMVDVDADKGVIKKIN